MNRRNLEILRNTIDTHKTIKITLNIYDQVLKFFFNHFLYFLYFHFEVFPMSNLHSERKPRVVRNALIDIHDISTQPGQNYCNWTPIVYSKLSDREWQIFTQKCNKIVSITNQVFNLFFYPKITNKSPINHQ